MSGILLSGDSNREIFLIQGVGAIYDVYSV